MPYMITENDDGFYYVYKQDEKGEPKGSPIKRCNGYLEARAFELAIYSNIDFDNKDELLPQNETKQGTIEQKKSIYQEGKEEDNSLKENDEKDDVMAFGASVKAIGMVAKDGNTYGRIGGYLVLFGNEINKDLVGDYFTEDTYFGPESGNNRDVMVHHGRALKTGDYELDKQLKEYSDYLLQPMQTKRDSLGIWAETMLDLSKSYERMIYDLSKKGVFKWSSGSASHMVRRKDDAKNGEITRWPIIEGSLTPTPAEPRMVRNVVMPLKSVDDEYIIPKSILCNFAKDISLGNIEMSMDDDENEFVKEGSLNILNRIIEKVPGLDDDQIKSLDAILDLVSDASVKANSKTKKDGVDKKETPVGWDEEEKDRVDDFLVEDDGDGSTTSAPKRKTQVAESENVDEEDKIGSKPFPFAPKRKTQVAEPENVDEEEVDDEEDAEEEVSKPFPPKLKTKAAKSVDVEEEDVEEEVSTPFPSKLKTRAAKSVDVEEEDAEEEVSTPFPPKLKTKAAKSVDVEEEDAEEEAPVKKPKSSKPSLTKALQKKPDAEEEVEEEDEEELDFDAFNEIVGKEVEYESESDDEEEVAFDEEEIEPNQKRKVKKSMKINAEQAAKMLKAIGFTVEEGKSYRPPYDFGNKQVVEEDEHLNIRKSFNATYVMRYGDEGDAEKSVMVDVFGGDYRQLIWNQNNAFSKYLRFGTEVLDSNEVKMLKMQIFPANGIMQMVKDGFDIPAIKDTMVEAQNSLGGYAVPANIQSNIISRLPGLTAVRGGGAEVIVLANSNMIEVPYYAGGDNRFVGAERGAWGSEAQSPTEKNATLGMIDLRADVYTYKIPMSQSLVDDATNLVTMIQKNIANTLAMDEDEAFLVGDGVGKPLGVLPGHGNPLGLNEVHSGNASAIALNGCKALKRGVPTQYRQNAIWIANSSTMSAIEGLTFTDGPWAYPDLSEGDQLLGRKVVESEAMPDVSSSSYPMIFGDFSGYYIAERLGLTIVRFQDSQTGINKVEFHVRRRVGGRIVEPWKFAVMKVAA